MNVEMILGSGALIVVLMAAFMAWHWYRGRGAVSAQEAQDWALLAVEAVAQMYSDDQVDEGERFAKADEFLAKTLPKMDDIQRQILIEGAVFLLKKARERGILPRFDAPLEERVDALEAAVVDGIQRGMERGMGSR